MARAGGEPRPTTPPPSSSWSPSATRASVGFADITMDDIVDELDEPGFDRERDGWLVHGDDGRLLGWAWAFGRSAGASVRRRRALA